MRKPLIEFELALSFADVGSAVRETLPKKRCEEFGTLPKNFGSDTGCRLRRNDGAFSRTGGALYHCPIPNEKGAP